MTALLSDFGGSFVIFCFLLCDQVRKTAAVCTAKLYDVNREMVEEQGFINTLRDLISDPNPMVRPPCHCCTHDHPLAHHAGCF